MHIAWSTIVISISSTLGTLDNLFTESIGTSVQLAARALEKNQSTFFQKSQNLGENSTKLNVSSTTRVEN